MIVAPPAPVALFGAGIMGGPMAANLAAAGFAVKLWNRTAAKAAAWTRSGLTAAQSAREAARDAEVLILMLTDGPACDAVLFGEDGIEAVIRPGATVVVMSSIPVGTARDQAVRIKARGAAYVDAPVSGGEAGAIDGRLVIMAGGDPDRIAALGPVFAPLGRVTRVGDVGCGQLAKLANQLIVGVTIGAVAEAMLLIERGGGDAAAAHEALQGGFADSTVWRRHGQRMMAGDFAPGAYAEIQLKDMRTAVETGETLGLSLPFAALSRDLYARMLDSGRGRLDHSALYLEIASLAGA